MLAVKEQHAILDLLSSFVREAKVGAVGYQNGDEILDGTLEKSYFLVH